MPQTLKVTQTSVEKFRQTTSLTTARNRKNRPQRKRELAPALGVELEGRIEDIAEQRLAEEQAAEQHDAEQRVDDRRLHLDEGVVLQIERQRAEDEDDDARHQRHDRQGARRDSQDTSSAIAVAAMNRPVATKIGPPSSASAGNFWTSHSPRALAKKKTSSGPELQHQLEQRVDFPSALRDRRVAFANRFMAFLLHSISHEGSAAYRMAKAHGDAGDRLGEIARP